VKHTDEDAEHTRWSADVCVCVCVLRWQCRQQKSGSLDPEEFAEHNSIRRFGRYIKAYE